MTPGAGWTPAEVAYLRSLTVDQGMDSAQVAERFTQGGIARTQKSIQRKIAQERAHSPELWVHKIPPSQTRRYNEPLVVPSDAVVLPDIHAPLHDARWMNRVLALAAKWGIENAILAGDLADFNAFSKFGRDSGIDADTELDTLSRVLDAMCASFEVWYFAGNHDVRPCRALKDAGLNVTWLMRMFIPGDRCHISDYHWCNLDSGGQRFRIEHPRNTSMYGSVVPQKLCSKYLTSVIGAHGHVWGMSRDVSGRFWAIDSGVCCDPERLGYVAQISSTRPALYRGAVLVKESVPFLLSPDNIGMYERMNL